MAAIPSPYLSGCKIRRNDPRSYCTCYGGCKSDYPPPDQWVVNVQPTTKSPFSGFVGRRILHSTATGIDTCVWATDLGDYPRPGAICRLTKELTLPDGFLRWRLDFVGGFLCALASSFKTDAFGNCCVDLHWGILDTWFGTACAFGPGINPDIDLWPVPFDFEDADL